MRLPLSSKELAGALLKWEQYERAERETRVRSEHAVKDRGPPIVRPDCSPAKVTSPEVARPK
jgi:hypothetical protein